MALMTDSRGQLIVCQDTGGSGHGPLKTSVSSSALLLLSCPAAAGVVEGEQSQLRTISPRLPGQEKQADMSLTFSDKQQQQLGHFRN
ncbi:hypothetical protein PAMP_002112 [Pampus punctatissimus]